MNILKQTYLLFVFVFIVSGIMGQEYGPKPVKPYEIKLLKGKVLYIPEYDDKTGFVKVFVPQESLKEFKTEKEKNVEFKKRWDSALKVSSYDFTPYEIKWFNAGQLEQDRDKTAMCLFFSSDFYNNWYANLEIMDPKPLVIASVPVTDFDLSRISDIKLMMNMLAYSIIKSTSFYGDDAKSLYREHQYRYKRAIEAFADTIRQRTFLFTRYDKDRKKFKEHNEKLNEFMKINWKLSNFDFITASEMNKRLAEKRRSDYYLKSIPIKTSNEKMTYNYWLVLTASNNDVIYSNMGNVYLTSSNLKYFQINIEKWLHYFMTKKVRDRYTFVTNVKEKTSQTKSPATDNKTKQTKPPEKTKTPKATEPKTTTTKTKQVKEEPPKTKKDSKDKK